MLHRHDRGRHGGLIRRYVVVAVVVGVAAQGFARAHGGTGSPAAKQRTDQHFPQTPITGVRLVGVHPVPDAGRVVDGEGLLPHRLTGHDTAASERTTTGDRVVGDIRAGNRRGDGGVGECADGREEGAAPEFLAGDTFDFTHLGGAAGFDFRQHDGFGAGERTIRVDVPVLVEARVDVVGDADGVFHIGLLRGDLPRDGAVVVGTAEVVPGAATGRKAHGGDCEDHSPQDVGLEHGVIPHAGVNDDECRRLVRFNTIAMKRTYWCYYRHTTHICQ